MLQQHMQFGIMENDVQAAHPSSQCAVASCKPHITEPLAADTALLAPAWHMQVRREERMQSMLDALKVVCNELGEDDKYMAAEVHQSLIYMW